MQSIIICGLGFMGTMHLQAYLGIPSARLTGVVEKRKAHARKILNKLNLKDVPVFPTLEQALAAAECTVVDICLPTGLHESFALEAIAARKALFCEKPLTLEQPSARRILEAARKARVPAQVGQCIRFWPEYQAFTDLVKSGKAGKLLSLTLQRRSCLPSHSIGNWMQDPLKAGGAALDLHIHDTDFILSLLGTPASVRSRATFDKNGPSHIFTDYHYPKGPIVQAEGGWNYPKKWGFQMAFQAVFEKGAVEYDSGSTPTLRYCPTSGSPRPLPYQEAGIGNSAISGGNLSSLGGYLNELTYFIQTLDAGKKPAIATLPQAAESLRVCLAELKSAQTQKPIKL